MDKNYIYLRVKTYRGNKHDEPPHDYPCACTVLTVTTYYFEKPRSDVGLPPLSFTLTPAIQTSRSPQSSLGCRILSSQLSFRRSLSSSVFLEQHISGCSGVTPASAAPVGRMQQKPVYHAKVGDINYRCMAENVGDGASFSPLHLGLLTASLPRAQRPNSGHGRQRFQVPLYDRRYSGVFFLLLWRDEAFIHAYVTSL